MPEIIAIGDIHGMIGHLEDLLGRLPGAGSLVFLGDYLDRGPASREVITRLCALESERACVFLRGNHEAMALSALANDREMAATWLRNGGVATLESYDGRITPEHVRFLERTRPYFTTERYIFVHAGLPPGMQPEACDPEYLYWIRQPFLSTTYDWGRLVVHGHTPTADHEPDVRPNRVNIDTGAVYGGVLTALLLPERTCLHSAY